MKAPSGTQNKGWMVLFSETGILEEDLVILEEDLVWLGFRRKIQIWFAAG